MHEVTLVSIIHEEYGNCNSKESLKIIENICPDVIFLEALEGDYSKYDQMKFSQFGLYKERLELKAIQMYCQNHSAEYVPVLDIELSNEFYTKIKIISENTNYQKLLDNYNLLKKDGGFQFLNSKKSVFLQEEMRELENQLIKDEILRRKINVSINEYENSMLRNIYSFCKGKSFNKAIFMCGIAHRKSIIEKIGGYEKNSEIELNWAFYNDM